MEILGAVSASADLLQLSTKASKEARRLVQAFLNAPTELVELATELEQLHAKVEQIQGLCDDIAAAPTSPSGSSSSPTADTLLPPEHRRALHIALQESLEALNSIERLCNRQRVKHSQGCNGQMPASLQDVRHRIRWASINKRKASHILEDVKLAQARVMYVLGILSVRLNLLNRTSINVLSARQTNGFTALHAALETVSQDLKACIRSEMISVVEEVSTSTTVMHSTSSSTFQDGSEGSTSFVPPEDRPQTTIDEIDDRETRLMEHGTRMTLSRNSATFGDFGGIMATTATDTNTNTPKMGAVVTYESKRNRRKVKIAFFVGFKLFCNRILNFDIELQQWCSRGGANPWLGCSMTIFNIRPCDAYIFKACRRWDFRKVRWMIETGGASFYDVNEEIGGLLENVFEGDGFTYVYHRNIPRSESAFTRGLKLLKYLLDKGCDPNIFHGSMSRFRMPTVLKAFWMGYISTVSTLMAHGADLSSFGSAAAALLDEDMDDRIFPWKVRTLRNIGFSDWNVETEADNLLYGASWAGALEEVLFALEIAGIDPNTVGSLGRAPIGNAAQSDFFQGVAILIESGAKVNVGTNTWNGTPLHRSFDGSCRLRDMSHYLLSQGADPRLRNSRNETVWSCCINAAFGVSFAIYPVAWSFPRMEGEITHLLLHDADPFEFLAVVEDLQWFENGSLLDSAVDEEPALSRFYWSTYVQQVRLVEACRAWSYALPKDSRWTRGGFKPEFELREQTRTPKFPCTWSSSGLIYHDLFETDSTSSEDSIDSHYGDTDTEDESTDSPIEERSRPEKPVSPWNDRLPKADGHSSNGSNVIEDCEDNSTEDEKVVIPVATNHVEDGENLSAGEEYDSLSDNGDSSEDDHLSELLYEDIFGQTYWREQVPRGGFHFPPNASNFPQHISTEEGRRQLARFPLVRAFCDALQHAGYRAEMDDDGDIWYDADEDGMRYFDAREHQPLEELEDWPVEECWICRDFEAYGLGYVLEEVAEGKRILKEYKEQVKRAKRRYF